MPNRRLLPLCLALSSLFLSHVRGSARSCVRASPAGDGRTRVTVLLEDAAGARSLYRSLWSGDTSLVACEVSSDPAHAERHRALCRGGSSASQRAARRFDLRALLAPDAPCARVSSSAPEFSGRTWRAGTGTARTVRRKRAWMFPGTLWCGLGSRADGYEELGMFERTDRCCREHDHCQHIIPAFTVKYGVFNSKFFTVSHCDCDRRFRQCLLSVNDTISSMVGYSFFSILQVPCFELTQQSRCAHMFWSRRCRVVTQSLHAVFKSPRPYNSSGVTSQRGDSNLTSSEGKHAAITNPNRRASEHGCGSRDPPRGDTFYRRRKKGKGCKRKEKRKLYKAAPSQMTPISVAHSPSPSDILNASISSLAISKTRRDGKRRSIHSTPAQSTQRGQIYPQVTTNSYPQTTTTPPAAITAATKTTASHKNAPKKGLCCGALGMLLKNDTFWLHCEGCLDQNTTAAPKGEDSKPQQQVDSHFQRNNSSREPTGGFQHKHAEKSLTEEQCGSLKHLDECRHKIPPLEKKYDLQNTESKTAYHCDCTSRLAVQIESLKRPSILPTLLRDFVAERCFKLPKEKKCHSRKSCSRGFTKASDLLQALKKIEEKDTTGVRNSVNDRKRGIPVRLYKRCLRLEREADIMTQLTRL